MAERSGWAPPDPDDEATRSGQPEPPPYGQDDQTRLTGPPAPPPAPAAPPAPASDGWSRPSLDKAPEAAADGWNSGPGIGNPANGGQWNGGAANPPPTQWGSPGESQPPVQWGQPGAMPIAPKPGIIPLRPLGVSEILDGAFASMRLNPGATFGLTALVMTSVGLFGFLFNLAERDAASGAEAVLALLWFVVVLSAQSIVAGLLSVVVSEGVLGSRITLGDALRRIRPRIAGLVLLGFAVLGLIIVGVLGLIIGAIWVEVLLCVAGPAYALEGGNVRAALRRSRGLIKGAWWRTFGITILVGLIATFLSYVVLLPFSLAAHAVGGGATFGSATSSSSTLGLFVVAVGTIVGYTITVPISSGTIALIYVDRRIRAEGLDVTLAQAARERAAASPDS